MEYLDSKLRRKLLEFWQQHKVETIYLCLSGLFLLFSVLMYYFAIFSQQKIIQKNFKESDSQISNNLIDQSKSAKKIIVDIAGSVQKPDSYQLIENSRLKDLLVEAGGLSSSADRDFFNRNYNLAKILIDGEKIYIPSKKEVEVGLFTDATFVIGTVAGAASNNQLININSASQKELEDLPGIGPSTAQKIISNRPYSATVDLLDKKVVNKGTWNKIKDLIGI